MSPRVPGFSYDGRSKTARFVIYVPGLKGKARRKTTAYGVTRDEALLRYAAFREEVGAGADGPAHSDLPRKTRRRILTFREFIERYWEKIAARVTAKTARSYRYIVEKHLLPAFGSTRLDRINSAAIQDFAALLRKSEYAPATINDYVNILLLLLHQAVEREEIPVLSVRGRLPREKGSKPRLELSPEEEEKFLAAFEDMAGFRRYLASHRTAGRVVKSAFFGETPRVFGGGIRPDGEAARFYFERFRISKPIFVVALETGLRRGDLLRLRWSDVDLQNGWLRLRTQKTGAEVAIPLSTSCRQALVACREREVLGERVFTDEAGKPFPVVRLLRHFRVAKEIAGITRRFRFHDLRHTFASTLASRGVSLQVIAKALGHTSVKMSERYARPSEESMRAIVEALAARTTS